MSAPKNDLTGMVFSKWAVISFEGRDSRSEQLYSCVCECGTKKIIRGSLLKSKMTTQCKSCFVSSLNKTECLIGKKFGKWTVLSKKINEKTVQINYLCRCSCGTERYITGSSLKSKQTTQCHRCRVKTHGLSQTNTFRIWSGILARCLNKNLKAYKYYGARGIVVCDRWRESFLNFLSDMGERPIGLHIDRIDNDGNYEPGNCRWVTPAVNHANRVRKKG